MPRGKRDIPVVGGLRNGNGDEVREEKETAPTLTLNDAEQGMCRFHSGRLLTELCNIDCVPLDFYYSASEPDEPLQTIQMGSIRTGLRSNVFAHNQLANSRHVVVLNNKTGKVNDPTYNASGNWWDLKYYLLELLKQLYVYDASLHYNANLTFSVKGKVAMIPMMVNYTN